MKKQQRNYVRYPDQHKDILNLAVSPWLEKRIKKVLKQGKKKRIAKYKNIDPFEFRIEYPSVFSKKKGYFRSTVVARKNGLCFPDPKIPFVTFEQFIKHIDPDGVIYNPDFIDITDLTAFEDYATSIDKFPDTPEYILIQNNDNYTLLIVSENIEIGFEDIFTTLFKNYRLQDITVTIKEEADSDYPTGRQESVSGYVVGKITVTDKVFNSSPIAIDIINVRLVNNILATHEKKYDGYYYYNGSIDYSNDISYQ